MQFVFLCLLALSGARAASASDYYVGSPSVADTYPDGVYNNPWYGYAQKITLPEVANVKYIAVWPTLSGAPATSTCPSWYVDLIKDDGTLVGHSSSITNNGSDFHNILGGKPTNGACFAAFSPSSTGTTTPAGDYYLYVGSLNNFFSYGWRIRGDLGSYSDMAQVYQIQYGSFQSVAASVFPPTRIAFALVAATTTVPYVPLTDPTASSSTAMLTCDSTLDLGCQFHNALVALFYPDPDASDKFHSLATVASTTWPFSYAYDIPVFRNELFNTATTAELALVASTSKYRIPLISKASVEAVPYATWVRNILGILAWLITVETLYRMVLQAHNKDVGTQK